MKNGRRNNNNDSTRGRKETGTNSRRSIDDGTTVRRNDSGESPNTIESGAIRKQSSDVVTTSGREQQTVTTAKLADGFYFTPDGTIERIPDGHFISNGRLRKRRNRSGASDSANGDENRDRTETGEPKEFSTEDFLLKEKPLKVGVGRKKKKLSETQERLTMVAMLSVASTALFTSVSLLTKHKHWELEKEEAHILAESLNEALATLPTKTYAAIIAIIEKWVPWVNLIFAISAIIIPRIEESAKRFEATHYKPAYGVNDRNARTEDNPFTSQSSLGFNE